MEKQWKIKENPVFFRKCLNKNFDDQKTYFFKTNFFGTYIPTENPKNAILWQSDKICDHQTTVNRVHEFAKNQENRDILQWAPS